MFWYVAAVHAAPLHADKRRYDVALVGSLGLGGRAPPLPFARASLLARVADHAVLEGAVLNLPSDLIRDGGGTEVRSSSVLVGAGGAWSLGATGLHGVQLGARAVAGPVQYSWSASTTSCTRPTASADTTCVLSGQDPDLPVRSTRVQVQPHVRAQWIGHPGLTLGAELGLDVVASAPLAPGEPRVTPYAVLSLGWAAALDERPISSAAALARLSPDDAARRRRQNRAVAIGAGSVAGAGALGFGAVVLSLVLNPTHIGVY